MIDQHHRPLRLVVSDNASDDGTAEALGQLATRGAEVSIFVGESNIGPSANFERVRDEATGEFFMWLGDDDWLDESYIDECVRELNADRQIVMVAGACRYHSVDSEWQESPLINLLQDNAGDRVLEYFRTVKANGVFYGLTRLDTLQHLPAVPNVMGGDWLHVARLAFLGHVKTLEHVEVHRSVGGATRSLAEVARHQKLGWLSTNAPQLALAWVAVSDIGWRSPVYEPLSRMGRLLLGVRSAMVILTRFLPSAFTKYLRVQRDRFTRRQRITAVHLPGIKAKS